MSNFAAVPGTAALTATTPVISLGLARPGAERSETATTAAPLDDPELISFRARLPELTGREREVLRAVVAGHTSKVIAHQLGISPRTVQVHRARITSKLGVRGVCKLVRLALVVGLPENDHQRGARADDQ